MIVFDNEGLLDLDCITTFGISVKEGDNAIGCFGTGLKYAIAICMRERIPLAFYIDGGRYLFGVQEKTVRGESFEFITMNGEQLGFTTRLGVNWEPWQAFRELYCNCTDENGSVYPVESVPQEGLSGRTVIVADGMDELYAKRGEIILQSDPIYETPFVEIHPNDGNNGGVYYRGIKAYTPHQPLIHTWNIKASMDLTEDRTLADQHAVHTRIRRTIISECHNKKIIHAAITAPEGFLEHEYDFDLPWFTTSQEFLDTVAPLYHDHSGYVNKTAIALYCRRMERDIDDLDPVELTHVESMMLARAVGFLVQAGMKVDDFEIVPVEDLGDGVQGTVRDGKIFVSRLCFRMGTKALAGTLFEEYVHLRTRYGDFTRSLQNYLVDLVMTLLEDKVGEPL